MTTRLAALMYRVNRLEQRVAPLIDRAEALHDRLPWRRAAPGSTLPPATICADPCEFLNHLRAEVLAHPAVNHPLLARIAHVPFVREDYRIFAVQHHALVEPEHAELYREFLRATGVADGEELSIPLHAGVTELLAERRRIRRAEPFLVGLGALGPGHAWSVPKMFERIVRGLRRAGLAEREIRYFTLAVEQDNSWLEQALVRHANSPEAQAQLHRGAMLSLTAWVSFWSGVQDKLVRWRQPRNVHPRSRSRRLSDELTLAQWRALDGGAM